MFTVVTRIVLFGMVAPLILLGAISGSESGSGQEPGEHAKASLTKEHVVAQWRKFVGTWTVTNEGGNTSQTQIIESHPNVFVHSGADFTVIVGWDAEQQSMHAYGFSTDDRPFEQLWTLVDDAPTFHGHLLGTEERFQWTIHEGVWMMDFGSFGTSTAKRD